MMKIRYSSKKNLSTTLVANFPKMLQKNVLVLYTGGTIGMQKNENNAYAPSPNTFVKALKGIPLLHNNTNAPSSEPNQLSTSFNNTEISYTIKEYDPLLDSSNMSDQEWIKIAQDIEDNFSKYHGFVVLHGTDTLAYTSSVLSFMFENLSKPVILTGAQIPIFEVNTDAIRNIYMSLVFAGCYDIPEVCVYFFNKLMRGNRTKKVNTIGFEGFQSPNYPALAQVDWLRIVKFNKTLILPRSNEELIVNKSINRNVIILYFFPTISVEQIDSLLQPPTAGAILLTFGTGGIQSNRGDIINVFKDAVKRNVVIINVSQCIRGSVSPAYETVQELEKIGIITGYDMTIEAAYAKLMVILGSNDGNQGKKLRENLRGEITIKEDTHNTNNNNNNSNISN